MIFATISWFTLMMMMLLWLWVFLAISLLSLWLISGGISKFIGTIRSIIDSTP